MFFNDYRDIVRFDEAKMAKVNLFETHRMFADLYCMLPQQQQSVHVHDDSDKFYCVLEGTATLVIGEEERRLDPGGICIAPAGAPHGVRNDTTAPCVLLVSMAPHPRLRES